MVDSAVNWQLTLEAAEQYDRYSRFMLEPWVPVLLERVDLKLGERVLDVACGTGFVARQAARAVGVTGIVTGVDINNAMLAIAKAHSEELAPMKVCWHQADVCDLPFSDDIFDAVLCQQGLQFFPDGIGALREIKRTLKAGGRIGLSVWGPRLENPYFHAIDDVISRHMGEDVASRLRKPLTLDEPQKVRALLDEAGFRNVDIRKTTTMMCTPPYGEFLPNHLRAMPIAGEINTLPVAAHSDLIEDLVTSLNPYLEGDRIQVPGTVLVATAFL